jgi:hypothetical protein
MNGKKPRQDSEWIKSARGKMISLTALLVVVPALINSGLDAYKAVANIPTNIYDRANDELFKKHFKEIPTISEPVPVKNSAMTVDMLLEVYPNGDIFIRYGEFRQWFPFKPLTAASLQLVAEASADTLQETNSHEAQEETREIFHDIREIDLGKMNRESAQRDSLNPKAETIERTYLLAEIKDDHPSLLHTSVRGYTATFAAEPGYRITKQDLRISSTNRFKLRSVELIRDGAEVHVSYFLTSGPIIDQWRGWVKGTLWTTQRRVGKTAVP